MVPISWVANRTVIVGNEPRTRTLATFPANRWSSLVTPAGQARVCCSRRRSGFCLKSKAPARLVAEASYLVRAGRSSQLSTKRRIEL